MKNLKTIFASLALSLALTLGLGLATAAANTPTDNGSSGGASKSLSVSDACDGLEQLGNGAKCNTGNTGESTLNNLARTVVGILSWLAGIATIIFVIFAGFKYTTSGGDSNKVGSAKTTLVYALVGLVVVALSQVLIRFVFNAATGSESACKYTVTDSYKNKLAGLTASDPLCVKP